MLLLLSEWGIIDANNTASLELYLNSKKRVRTTRPVIKNPTMSERAVGGIGRYCCPNGHRVTASSANCLFCSGENSERQNSSIDNNPAIKKVTVAAGKDSAAEYFREQSADFSQEKLIQKKISGSDAAPVGRNDELEKLCTCAREGTNTIVIKKQMLVRDRVNFWKGNEDYFILKSREEQLRYQLSRAPGIARRTSIENELIKIKNKLQFATIPVYTENTVTLEAIRQLELQLNSVDTTHAFINAELKYINLPDSILLLK